MLNHDAALDWKTFGEQDPYFGVLSDPKYAGRTLSEPLRTDFFHSGDDHVRNLIEVLEDGFGDITRGSALDFGCGVGRITQALAKEFDAVVGLDISPGMLAEARRNAQVSGFANVTYASSSDPVYLQPASHDLVHSYIVLQHIPVATGEAIVEQLISAVKPGGIGARRNPAQLREAQPRAADHRQSGERTGMEHPRHGNEPLSHRADNRDARPVRDRAFPLHPRR
jgi:trans-aconitate methyltransferase